MDNPMQFINIDYYNTFHHRDNIEKHNIGNTQSSALLPYNIARVNFYFHLQSNWRFK